MAISKMKYLIQYPVIYSRSDSENSLSSEPSSQFLAMSKLPPPPHPFNGAGINAGMTETSSEKDNNKNNLLLAMLWLQRHREIMSLSQQNTDSPTSKVRFLWAIFYTGWGLDIDCIYYFLCSYLPKRFTDFLNFSFLKLNLLFYYNNTTKSYYKTM